VCGSDATRVADIHCDDYGAALIFFLQLAASALERSFISASHHNRQALREKLTTRFEAKAAIPVTSATRGRVVTVEF